MRQTWKSVNDVIVTGVVKRADLSPDHIFVFGLKLDNNMQAAEADIISFLSNFHNEVLGGFCGIITHIYTWIPAASKSTVRIPACQHRQCSHEIWYDFYFHHLGRESNLLKTIKVDSKTEPSVQNAAKMRTKQEVCHSSTRFTLHADWLKHNQSIFLMFHYFV